MFAVKSVCKGQTIYDPHFFHTPNPNNIPAPQADEQIDVSYMLCLHSLIYKSYTRYILCGPRLLNDETSYDLSETFKTFLKLRLYLQFHFHFFFIIICLFSSLFSVDTNAKHGSNTKLFICFWLWKWVHTPAYPNLDGQKLDMGILLLRCLYAGYLWWTVLYAE